jgi:hexosaminidase
MRARLSLGVLALLAGSSPGVAQSAEVPAIIPRPVSMRVGRGSFLVGPRTTIWTDRADSAVAVGFARTLGPATGFDLVVKIGSTAAGHRIVFRRAAAKDTSLGPEGYRLQVTTEAITIASSAPAGAYYATQTIR